MLLLFFLIICLTFQNSFQNKITVIRNNGRDIFKGMECIDHGVYHKSYEDGDGCKCIPFQPTFYKKNGTDLYSCYKLEYIRGPGGMTFLM